MSEFTEVGERVWVARYEQHDVNVCVVEGDKGLLVVDTQASAEAAREVIADLRRLSRRPVVGIVNTHDHFDHHLGNATFRQEYADPPVVAHEGADVAADRTFSSATALDLGDRVVELVHPGRGHTGGDLVVVIPDARVVLAGDLVEESAPPSYGEDCFPLEWPGTLDLVLQLVVPDARVVPGHGAPVDRDFVEQQRADVGVVAETIRQLAGSGVPPDDALARGEWPFPTEGLGAAVLRGYAQLPRSGRSLPLL